MTETLTMIGIYVIIVGTFIYIFKRAKDFDDESREEGFKMPLSEYNKMLEDFNELTRKTTEENNRSKTIRITRTGGETKRVQGRVRKTIRRSKVKTRKRDAGTAKRATGNRSRAAKKV